MTTYKKIYNDGQECAVEYAFKAGKLGSAKGDATHPIYIDSTGTPQVCTGISATQADTLTPGRTIRTDLASETAPLFDGSANITPGVTGVLPVAHGGTGNSAVDTTPTADSTKMVTSGGVQAQIAAEASSRVSDITNLVGQIATEKTTRADADNALGARIDNVINGTTPPTTISGILPIQNGGTGSSTQNFVDLSSSQTIGGTKQFTDNLQIQSTAERGLLTYRLRTLGSWERHRWDRTYGGLFGQILLGTYMVVNDNGNTFSSISSFANNAGSEARLEINMYKNGTQNLVLAKTHNGTTTYHTVATL